MRRSAPAPAALRLIAIAWLLLPVACQGSASPEPSPSSHTPAAAQTAGVDADLADVARIHGGAGPWAVAGFRMGAYALKKLGIEKQSFDLEVVHHSPQKVQFSCIADGAAAATGASVGKLNLSLVDADDAHVMTTYRRKSTGAQVTLRPSAAFRSRFFDVPQEQIAEAGRTAMTLPDAEVFEEVP